MSEKCFSSFNGYQVKDPVARAATNEHAGDIQLLRQEIESHESETNPHGITPEMIGAMPNTWTPDLSGVGNFPAEENMQHPGCYYMTVDGVIEWVNPPMVFGTEYRTIKRHNGKAVYTKAVDFGTLPDKTSKTVSLGVSGTLIGIYAFARSTGSVLAQFPIVNSAGTFLAKIHAGNEGVCVVSASSMSDYSAVVIAEYTKD